MQEVARTRLAAGSVFHFRGCSGEPNRLPRAYHSGDSEEVGGAQPDQETAVGAAPLHGVGISLGGNAFAKCSGNAAWKRSHRRERGDRLGAARSHGRGRSAGEGLHAGLCEHFLASLKKTSLASSRASRTFMTPIPCVGRGRCANSTTW